MRKHQFSEESGIGDFHENLLRCRWKAAWSVFYGFLATVALSASSKLELKFEELRVALLEIVNGKNLKITNLTVHSMKLGAMKAGKNKSAPGAHETGISV